MLLFKEDVKSKIKRNIAIIRDNQNDIRQTFMFIEGVLKCELKKEERPIEQELLQLKINSFEKDISQKQAETTGLISEIMGIVDQLFDSEVTK